MINPIIVNKVAQELNIQPEVVKAAYNSYWEFIRNTIQSLPLKDNINEEEFSLLRTNFNIPSLGKLSCSFNRMIGVKKKFNHIK